MYSPCKCGQAARLCVCDVDVAELRTERNVLRVERDDALAHVARLEQQAETLRRERDEARALPLSERVAHMLHKARADERTKVEAEVVAWLRSMGLEYWPAAIEAGAHRPATKEGT